MNTKPSRIAVAAACLLALAAVPAAADKPDKDKHGKNDAKHEQQQAKRHDQRRQQLIRAQKARASAYDRRLAQQTRLLSQRTESLRDARRLAQYRYQQEYVARLNQQQATVKRGWDYDKDPYYTTAPSWRYSRGGRSYQVNQYAADVLKTAVNQGYEQGVRAGAADHEDRFGRARYQDSYAYRDATYGYDGAYLDVSEYQYYFREGFRRGYGDGLGSRWQYGAQQGGKAMMLATVLDTILRLQAVR